MSPLIEVIVPTYKRPDFLLLLIQSLKVQTFRNWKISVIIDSKDDVESIELMKDASKENISFVVIDGPHKDWGHTAREYGLKHANSDWVLMTGDDNYYVPTFIEYFTTSIVENPNSILHYSNLVCGNVNTENYPLKSNYILMDTKIKKGVIDICCFLTKTQLAKEIGYPFRTISGDYDYLDAYLSKFGKQALSLTTKEIVYGNIVKINKFLCVHN